MAGLPDIQRIIFVMFSDKNRAIYQSSLELILPDFMAVPVL
jgi:hypothetical protein